MRNLTPTTWQRIDLDLCNHLLQGRLPAECSAEFRNRFDELWELHPPEPRRLLIHGREVPAPRWDQAYGCDYVYSGQVNAAESVPDILCPLLNWVNAAIDSRLNGVLVNWYDGSLGHYIGPHRDSVQNLVADSPIVTVSLGEERIFRMRPVAGKGYVDIPIPHGSVVIVPYATNRTWKHEVPRSKRHRGKRISVTFRAFTN